METPIFIVVELENGDQFFFDTPYEGFKYAKEQEDFKRNSVNYVAIGNFYESDGQVYRGQQLRYLLRALDKINDWIKASQLDEHNEIQAMD